MVSEDTAAVESKIGRSCLLIDLPTIVGLAVSKRKTRMLAARSEPGKSRRKRLGWRAEACWTALAGDRVKGMHGATR